MPKDELYTLYDESETTQTRFISFVGEAHRFDLGITVTDRFYGKLLVFNIQSNRYALIGEDDLEEPGYIEHVYGISEAEAAELRDFLHTLF
ncbi:DUF3055 domain-containing protein [Kroppenstedtia eburnea]|uniref:DUF3055 domain-containing protein n=1 Tax=Kroppenstedtia eburnea TaxID=714067 RepID=A0A1N7LIB9_9BACL|nr:DUF3055 domain-containing protein [Kroppenstedtia eburnea]EGK07836.1 hypothetical protein HMPREF9374_3556 [Desmospora sp. 8437]QKI81326.1 DUF3055 domain-containing protein [Kroppenstedtia eburnea]SIS73534.1 Protein of unknown function [Kroppenstedtia eburnea]